MPSGNYCTGSALTTGPPPTYTPATAPSAAAPPLPAPATQQMPDQAPGGSVRRRLRLVPVPVHGSRAAIARARAAFDGVILFAGGTTTGASTFLAPTKALSKLVVPKDRPVDALPHEDGRRQGAAVPVL